MPLIVASCGAVVGRSARSGSSYDVPSGSVPVNRAERHVQDVAGVRQAHVDDPVGRR